MEKIFKSKCKFDEIGNQLDDVGGWCWFWIVLHIISLFSYLINGVIKAKNLKSKGKKDEVNSVYLKTFISMIISLLMIYFIYSMCKLCRGWTAFGIILIISCLQGAYFYL
jgi:hypothetical protein